MSHLSFALARLSMVGVGVAATRLARVAMVAVKRNFMVARILFSKSSDLCELSVKMMRSRACTLAGSCSHRFYTRFGTTFSPEITLQPHHHEVVSNAVA